MYDNTAMIQIYTGNGKGKTTAALGLAFRALGQGRRVLLVQFMKKRKDSGELKAARRFSKFKILQTGQTGWVRKAAVTIKTRQFAQKGLRAAQKAIAGKKYDLIILDELNVAVDFGLLDLVQVKQILEASPKSIELIITGRGAHPEIIELADMVSEVREMKHYYKKGIACRAGIEY